MGIKSGGCNLDNYKNGLSLLRGQAVTARIKYQRGEDWTFTSYDLLHSLNSYEIDIDKDYITLLAPSENKMIHSIIYNNAEYNFYKFGEQLEHEILEIWERLENLGLAKKNYRRLLQELLWVDLRRVIIPEEVVLKDGKKVDIKNYVRKWASSENVSIAPSNIL